MSIQTTLPGIASATFSLALESGVTLSDKQDGPTTNRSGQDHALANLSALQAKEKGLLMSGTYGQPGNISSKSKSLNAFLESRLRAKTDLIGSTLYKLTWKERTTPSGLTISALRASVLRTSGNACILLGPWPTPSKRDHKGGYLGGRIRNGKLSTDTLDVTAQLAGWGTPTANPANGEPEQFLARKRKAVTNGAKMGVSVTDIQMQAKLAGWPTPLASDTTGSKAPPNRQSGASLKTAVTLVGWPTPKSSEARSGLRAADGKRGLNALDLTKNMDCPARLTATGEILTGSDAVTGSGGQLNPALSLWLMGLPAVFCESAVTAMAS